MSDDYQSDDENSLAGERISEACKLSSIRVSHQQHLQLCSGTLPICLTTKRASR